MTRTFPKTFHTQAASVLRNHRRSVLLVSVQAASEFPTYLTTPSPGKRSVMQRIGVPKRSCTETKRDLMPKERTYHTTQIQCQVSQNACLLSYTPKSRAGIARLRDASILQ